MENKVNENNKNVKTDEGQNMENKVNENNAAINEIYDIKSNISKILSKYKNKEEISDSYIINLIYEEIENLNSIDDLKSAKFKIIKVDNKIEGIIDEQNNIYTTTVAYAIIKNRKSKDIGNILEKAFAIDYKSYIKQNSMFMKGFEYNIRKFSDIRVFIFNFLKVERLNKESEKIIKGIMKEKKVQNKKKSA